MNQTPNNLAVYNTAKSLLGKRLTLDPTVPKELQCAQSISYILKQAGIKGIPKKGFSSTKALYAFLSDNQPQFWYTVPAPLQGDIVLCVTGEGKYPHGHAGIWGKTHVMSNSSDNGLWEPNYTHLQWRKYFGETGKFPIHFFRRL